MWYNCMREKGMCAIPINHHDVSHGDNHVGILCYSNFKGFIYYYNDDILMSYFFFSFKLDTISYCVSFMSDARILPAARLRQWRVCVFVTVIPKYMDHVWCSSTHFLGKCIYKYKHP